MSASRATLRRSHRPRRSLAARGQFLNTFAGLGFSVALSFLLGGVYLIAEEFANPLGAQSAVLVLAALLITTSMTLFYCLLHPCRKSRRHAALLPAEISWEQKTAVVARFNTGTGKKDRNDPPVRGRYLDSARIGLRR